MTIAAGSKLGPYEILGQIGAGGMGEVYRAKDPRLGRDVAIKVLPASFSADADRLRRFEQEARAAGVLNHPNITAVLDIGEHEGAPYVVQELLEGETLRQALAGGCLSPRTAIEHAVQIAHGLAAAHEKGIVHRDLKPENVFVTKDGRVKILDFGLAKLTHPEEGSFGGTNLPTASGGTEPGVVLGTLGYMSPEQVKGRSADSRSDIFWVVSQTESEKGDARLTLLPTGPGDPRPLPIGKVRPRAISQESARWSQDGRLLLFSGSEPGRPARAWLLDLAGAGPPRAVTPEGCSLAVLSPDGGSVATVDPDGKMLLCSVAGGPPKEVLGALPGEFPLEWEASGKTLFLWDRTWPARITRLELETGRRTIWKELAADPVGLLYGNVILARDGQHYVYRLRRVLSELNVAEGLK